MLKLFPMKKEEKKYSLSAGAIVLNPQNQVLLVYQVENQYWEFPKGKIEPGEKIEDTFKRELSEETGITQFEIIPGFKETVSYKFKIDSEIINRQAIYYLIRTSQAVQLSSEHSKYQWVSLEAAKKILKHKNQRFLINKTQKYAI